MPHKLLLFSRAANINCPYTHAHTPSQPTRPTPACLRTAPRCPSLAARISGARTTPTTLATTPTTLVPEVVIGADSANRRPRMHRTMQMIDCAGHQSINQSIQQCRSSSCEQCTSLQTSLNSRIVFRACVKTEEGQSAVRLHRHSTAASAHSISP